jgi:tetratricopeptide (TPR) repeat protein
LSIPTTAPIDDAPAHHARGRKLLQEDKYREAIEELTQAIRLDPVLAQAYNARGFAYFKLKQYSKAISDFDQAIRLYPGYANAFVNRAATKRAAGNQAGAEADQARARALTK